MKLVGKLLDKEALGKSDDVIDLGADVVDMEPYKVKDISNFYFRDHPKGLNPITPRYKKYWLDFARDSIEGKWVDDEGTWYWIPPKSFFYINYLTLEDAKRNPIHPHYRDIDRIIGRYITCCDGFSGFEFDDEYTCNKLVKEKIEGTLRAVKEKDITENCYNSVTGELKVYIDPWEYLMRHYLIDSPAEKPLGRALWENPVQNMMILSGRGVGKALKKTEKVRIVNGWTEIQNLKIGDKIYGGDGLLTNVTDVFGGQKDLSFYKFTLSDGRTIDSCEDHQWKVFDRKKTNGSGEKRGGYVVKTTKDLLPFYKNERIDSKYKAKHGVDKYIDEYRFAIPLNGSLSSDHNDVTIDPYTLGLFLGDGCITGKKGSSINLTSADDEIINYVYNKHPELDYKKITEVKNHKKISFGEAQNSFRTNLNDYGLLGTYSDTKFIPTEYLHNTEEVKLELLKGLMDTDGWSNDRGVIEYYTVSNQLADDVEYLIRSLGMGCHRSIKPSHYKKGCLRVDCKDCHRLRIFTDEAVFKLERKLKYLGHIKSKAGQSKKEKTFITNIEYIGKKDGVCIKVDNKDHTFITKDHIVTHNSTSVFIGDFMHEWLFCGVQRYEEFFTDSQRKYLFAMASADSANLNRSVSLIDSNMTRLPGRYRFPVTDDGSVPDYFGPYYKNFIGTWKVGQTVRHVEKDASGNITTVGSVSQIRVITPDKTKIVAGDRFRRIYIEEVGFQENIMEVHANSVDSLKLNGKRVGSAVYLGTSGDIKAFRQANDLFNNPETYDIFGIKNYWFNSTKPIGLFIPAYYSQRDYSDTNHNTDIVEAFKYIIQTRKKARETASSMAYAKMVMYNPVEPKEMMRPSGDSILPKQEAQDAHTKLEVYDIFRKRAIIGSLFYDKTVDRGVRFKHDLENKLHPITTYDTTHYPNTEGALILYETPLSDPPKDLYWIVYDPAAQSGTGTSLHSIIVYKYSFSGNDNSLEDTIVAEWLGRLPTLEENWNLVLMIARYFDAKIFPEYNTPGFLDWCSQRKLFNYLQPENMALKKEINPRAKSSAWRKGFRMDARAKGWALNKLRDWLLEVKERDENGIPTKRVIDTIYSPRILEEIIYFDPDDGNYDHISSLLGLMILHNALNNIPKPKVVDKWSEDDYFYTNEESIEYVTPYTRRARAAILNY